MKTLEDLKADAETLRAEIELLEKENQEAQRLEAEIKIARQALWALEGDRATILRAQEKRRQDKCEKETGHKWRYTGHSHNEDCYECDCGASKWV